MDYHFESDCDRQKRAFQARNRWRTPEPEIWLHIGNDIEDATADSVIAALQASPNAPVWLGINSNGGSGDACCRIYSALRAHIGETTAHVTGRALSGAVIAMFGCDVRSAEAQATIMVHNANCRIGGYKTAASLCNDAQWLAQLDDEMMQIISHRSRYPHWQLRADMEGEKYLTATEAWTLGILTVSPQ